MYCDDIALINQIAVAGNGIIFSRIRQKQCDIYINYILCM